MSSQRSKRVIYESDDGEENTPIDRYQNLHSQKKRIICESDEDADEDLNADRSRGLHRTDTKDISAVRDIARATRTSITHIRSDDESDPDATQPSDVPESSESAALTLVNSAAQKGTTRRSQRSAAVSARKQGDAIDSLQLLSAASRGPQTRGQRSSKEKALSKRETDSDVEEDEEDDESEYNSDSDSDSDSDNDNDSDGTFDESKTDQPKSSKVKSNGRSSASDNKSRSISSSTPANVTVTPHRSEISTRASSDRTQRQSAVKEAERESKQREIRRFSARQSALDAMQSSDEDTVDDEGVSDVEVVSRLGSTDTNSRDRKSPRTPSRSQSQPTSQSQSRSHSQGSQRWSQQSRSGISGSNAFIRRETMPEKENYSDDEVGLEDFIVGSDEEREEQLREMEAALREKAKKQKRKQKELRQREQEYATAQKDLSKANDKKEKIELERVRLLHSETKNRRRKIILEDDDDEEGGGVNDVHEDHVRLQYDPLQDAASSSTVKDLTVSESEGDEVEAGDASSQSNEEEEDEEEDEEEEEEEEDEEEEEEDLDGPMLYRRVDAMRDEEDEEEASNAHIRKVHNIIAI